MEYATRPERLDHTFSPKHKLDPLVRLYGDQKAVIDAMLRELTDMVPESGLFEIGIQLGGQTVIVRGAVVDGIIKVGTAFTP